MELKNQWLDIKFAPKGGSSILARVDGFIPCVVEWVVFEGEGKWCLDPDTFAEFSHFKEYWEATSYNPDKFIPLEMLG